MKFYEMIYEINDFMKNCPKVFEEIEFLSKIFFEFSKFNFDKRIHSTLNNPRIYY